jgi:hypothetical protein
MAVNKGAPVTGERRRYFRVEDSVHLEYRVLGADEYAALREAPPASDEADVTLQLRALSSQAGALLAGVRKDLPDVANYLAILDRKVELLARALVGRRFAGALQPDTPVDVSAGGIAFAIAEPLARGTPVQVRIVFFPSHLCIQAIGEVVHCEANAADANRAYHVGIEFTAIAEMARDALVRHTLERQSALLRERRQR